MCKSNSHKFAAKGTVLLVTLSVLVSFFAFEPKPAQGTEKYVDIQKNMLFNACGFEAVDYTPPEYKYGRFWPALCWCSEMIGCGEPEREPVYAMPESMLNKE